VQDVRPVHWPGTLAPLRLLVKRKGRVALRSINSFVLAGVAVLALGPAEAQESRAFTPLTIAAPQGQEVELAQAQPVTIHRTQYPAARPASQARGFDQHKAYLAGRARSAGVR